MEKEKTELAREKMAKVKTRAKTHATFSQRRKKDATKDNAVKGITDY